MKTRERILDATKQVIQERGRGRVTTKEIARTAGVAEGTLFKYFERKEDLLLAECSTLGSMTTIVSLLGHVPL